jgi:hypothetical protein
MGDSSPLGPATRIGGDERHAPLPWPNAVQATREMVSFLQSLDRCFAMVATADIGQIAAETL